MSTVHPTAILEGAIQLGDGVEIGPGCVLRGSITIGTGTRLIGNVWLQGPLTMGERNTIYPFVCLGFAPQHVRFDPKTAGKGLQIGDGNMFREHVTVHRALEEARPTTIGDRNFFMATSHAGHDSHVGDDCTFVNGSALGGHVEVQDRVTIGGGTMVHQFCRVGRGAMLSGGVGTTVDIPPWFMLTGTNVAGGVNLVGMRRARFSSEEIADVRWVYKTLCREGRSLTSAKAALAERRDRPRIAESLEFIESSKRPIVTAVASDLR